MCVNRMFLLCCFALPFLVCADSKQEGVISFKELGQEVGEGIGKMLDEMNIIAESFDQALQSSRDAIVTGGSIKPLFDTKISDNRLDIAVDVPGVENSDAIKAHVDKARQIFKVIVPQKDSLTKISIHNKDNQASIKMVIRQRREQKNDDKQRHSFYMSAQRRVSYKTVPFAVDFSKTSVEYKNDVLTISLEQAPVKAVKKAEPRVIPVQSK